MFRQIFSRVIKYICIHMFRQIYLLRVKYTIESRIINKQESFPRPIKNFETDFSKN